MTGMALRSRARHRFPPVGSAAVLPLLVFAAASCHRAEHKGGSARPSDAAYAGSAKSLAVEQAKLARDRREPSAIPSALASASEASARIVSAQSFAQIGQPTSSARLTLALADEDPSVVAWAVYGLAMPCDIEPSLRRDDRAQVVHEVVARASSFEAANPDGGVLPTKAARLNELDPWAAMAWALGRCGGLDASRELARWLRGDRARARAAAWALGAIAEHDRGLEDDVVRALLDAAGGEGKLALDEALFPFGRGDWSARPPAPRLADVVRVRLASPGPTRIYAIRAAGRIDGGTVADLCAFLASAQVSPTEQVEALRALHRLGAGGDDAIASFAMRFSPASAHGLPTDGAQFGPIRVALELLGENPNDAALGPLRAFANGSRPLHASLGAPAIRRTAALRCLAAGAVYHGRPADPDLLRCAQTDTPVTSGLRTELDGLTEQARLQAIDHGEIQSARRDLLFRIARMGSPRAKERALDIVSRHVEVVDAADILANALAAREPGVVSAAARAIAARPALAQALERDAIRKALDPRVPGPEVSNKPAAPGLRLGGSPLEIDERIRKALDGALARPLGEVDAEVRIDLAHAIARLHYVAGRSFLARMCGARTFALRQAAQRALEEVDAPNTPPRCDEVVDHGPPPDGALAMPLVRTVVLELDTGSTLKLHLDPAVSPLAATRIYELASSGFYDGLRVHRVVPGFVVQIGDPGGDGYGGASSTIRCETAPIAFERFDIGIALAGRDTGSSQFFVTLSRTPHLDGSYPWIGHAEGDWETVAEGDIILRAHPEEGQ